MGRGGTAIDQAPTPNRRAERMYQQLSSYDLMAGVQDWVERGCSGQEADLAAASLDALRRRRTLGGGKRPVDVLVDRAEIKLSARRRRVDAALAAIDKWIDSGSPRDSEGLIPAEVIEDAKRLAEYLGRRFDDIEYRGR